MTSGDDFIAIAGRLVAAPNQLGGTSVNPAAFRTAISRAYYGAYHLTLEFLKALGIEAGKEHNLHHDLCNCGNRDAEQAGKLLDDLYSRRRRADYELDRADVEELRYAQYTVEMAHRFRSYLNECKKEPARTTICAGIHAHRSRIKPK